MQYITKLTLELNVTRRLETLFKAIMFKLKTSRMLTTRARILQTKKTITTTINKFASPISFFCNLVKLALAELALLTSVYIRRLKTARQVKGTMYMTTRYNQVI